MNHKLTFYLGGYYLIKMQPVTFGGQFSKRVFTCSTCINDSFLDSWSYSYTPIDNASIDEIKKKLQIDDQKIQSIRAWVDGASNEKRIGWPDPFSDLETAQQYSQEFFPHIQDMQLMSVYFPEPEVADLLSEFNPQKEGFGSIGLYENLQRKVPENLSNTETFIGFDIIGIECGGDFHSFHCHDLANDLIERFHLTLNEYGLFEDNSDWQSVTRYMNTAENGFEPVPWFVCKIKLVNTVT